MRRRKVHHLKKFADPVDIWNTWESHPFTPPAGYLSLIDFANLIGTTPKALSDKINRAGYTYTPIYQRLKKMIPLSIVVKILDSMTIRKYEMDRDRYYTLHDMARKMGFCRGRIRNILSQNGLKPAIRGAIVLYDKDVVTKLWGTTHIYLRQLEKENE